MCRSLCRFHCLAHLNVIPRQDVAEVQRDIIELLRAPYTTPGVKIQADQESIYTTPIGRATTTTTTTHTHTHTHTCTLKHTFTYCT